MHVTSDTHFHSRHIASSGGNDNINSYNHRQQQQHHHQYPSSSSHQQQQHSYDTIDTSVWHSSSSSLSATNRYNNINVDDMGGTMSWSDENSVGSSDDVINEEEEDTVVGEIDENGKKKVVKLMIFIRFSHVFMCLLK